MQVLRTLIVLRNCLKPHHKLDIGNSDDGRQHIDKHGPLQLRPKLRSSRWELLLAGHLASAHFRPSRIFFAEVGIISGQPSLDNYRTSDFKPQFSIGPRL
jgi:hypothetical protein